MLSNLKMAQMHDDLPPYRVEETLGAAFAPRDLFPDFDPDILARHPELAAPGWLDPLSGKLTSSVHSWFFRKGGRTVLVDTCAGRRKADPAAAPFLSSLRKAGIAREDVDIVFLTHLHTDHMRWTTIREGERWQPTFPRARYVIGRREFAHWSPGGAGLALYPEQEAILDEAVAPLIAADRVDLVDDEAEILPGLRTQPAPGHTATQLMLTLSGGDARYVFAADSFHHPVQVLRPEWGSCFCEDQEQARTTRERILTECADTDAVLMPSHFGPPHAVTITRIGEGFGFRPVRLGS